MAPEVIMFTNQNSCHFIQNKIVSVWVKIEWIINISGNPHSTMKFESRLFENQDILF